jgi:hypothetical protein
MGQKTYRRRDRANVLLMSLIEWRWLVLWNGRDGVCQRSGSTLATLHGFIVNGVGAWNMVRSGSIEADYSGCSAATRPPNLFSLCLFATILEKLIMSDNKN